MNIEIANRLVKLRKEKGLSQEQLAEALGISRQAVSKWERAESSPDTDNLICLAKLYKVSLDELLNVDEDIETIKQEQIKEDLRYENEKTIINIDKSGIHIDDDIHISLGKVKVVKLDFSKKIDICLTILFVIAYLVMGFCFKLWHPGWTIFVLFLCTLTLVEAIRLKKIKKFDFELLVSFIYLLFSSIYHIWHPLWIILFTIPFYYVLIGIITKNND